MDQGSGQPELPQVTFQQNKLQQLLDWFEHQHIFAKITMLFLAIVTLATSIIVAQQTNLFSHAGTSILTNCTPIPSGLSPRQVEQLSQSGKVRWCNTSVIADFSSRLSTSYPVPSDIFGSNDYIPANFYTQFPTLMQQGGFRIFRRSINLSSIFSNPQSLTDPSKRIWSPLNALSAIQAGNIEPIFYFTYTPSWLQPNPNPCTEKGYAPQNAPPTSFATWGRLAQIAMEYIHKTYPNLHPSYEIWNEPDSDGEFCLPGHPSPTAAVRVNTYLSLYETVAPLIRQQAAADNESAKIGGPVIGENQGSEAIINAFLPAFLQDTKISSYIDFVSYHNYFLGKDWPTILSVTTDSQHGFSAKYAKVSSLVRMGKQHNSATTPIYIDEYNTGLTSSQPGCCRNSKIFAPVWNSLVIADLFHNISKDTKLLAPHIDYFEDADAKGQYCLFGVIDSAMDCATNGEMQPYPQFYTYKLLTDPSYLDLLNSAYITTAETTLPNVKVFSFYSATKDAVVMVNTSSSSYNNVSVTLQDPGTVAAPTAQVFTLDQGHPVITSSQLMLQRGTSGYTGSVFLPAYATVAISLLASTPPTPTPNPHAIIRETTINLQPKCVNGQSTLQGIWKPVAGAVSYEVNWWNNQGLGADKTNECWKEVTTPMVTIDATDNTNPATHRVLGSGPCFQTGAPIGVSFRVLKPKIGQFSDYSTVLSSVCQ